MVVLPQKGESYMQVLVYETVLLEPENIIIQSIT
jgi:hypothetical protein